MSDSIANLVSLKDKTAIVTGGAVGIGFGVSMRLAEAGANVVVADIHKENAELAVKELKRRGNFAMAVEADVSNEEHVSAMVKATADQFGSVDILVNNAGIYPNIPVMKMSLADFDKVISVNLKGVFLCTKYVAEKMIEQGRGGKIINITSIDALHPSMVGLAHYDASKHGVWGFTKNSALELAPHKIWVNALAPGGISTPGTGAGKPVSPDMAANIKKFSEKIPMGRMGESDEIGRVALFLASDLSSYMTGSQVVVDGGFLLA
jgi:2-deoxy-D-gluconate 3-dehydrogenase